jgi:hypothetical protein
MIKKIVVVLALASLVASPCLAQKKRKTPPSSGASKPISALASAGALYSSGTYEAAKAAIQAGRLPEALSGFCRMLTPPQGAPLWTVSVVLLCDPAEIPKALGAVRDPQPVFIMERIFEGRTCYRVCAGLTTDKREALAMRVRLPDSFKNAGPFPVEIPLPCEAGVPETAAAAPAGAKSEVAAPAASAPTAPHGGPVGPVGPETVELTPVAPAPVPAGPLPESEPPGATQATGGPQTNSAKGSSPFAPAPLSSGPGLPPSPPAAGRRAEVSRNPEAEAWFQKGLTAFNLGDRKLAEANYKKSLEISPNQPEALTNLGILYIEEKKYKEAKKLFESALAQVPTYSRAHLGLAGASWGLEEYREGIEEARSAVSLDSHDVSARLTLASFLRAVGEEEEAMKQARMVLLMEPNNQRAMEFVNTPPPKKVKKLKEKK